MKSESTRWCIAALWLSAAALASCGTAEAVPARAAATALSVWGFTAPWDAHSDSSVRANASRLDAAVTGWIRLDSLTGEPSAVYPDKGPQLAPGVPRVALVTSYQGTRFHPELVRALAANDTALAAAASHLATLLATGGYHGMVFDLEGATSADVPLMTRVVRAFGDSVRHHGVSPVTIAIPAPDTAAYPASAFIPAADFVVVMLYDQHWPASPPGSISSPQWIRNTLGHRIAEVGASHVIAALPVYGYEWRPGKPASSVSFASARQLTAQAGVTLDRDPVTQSLHATKPGEWELWLSDGQQLAALRAAVQQLGVNRVALWRLGFEDPAIWQALGR